MVFPYKWFRLPFGVAGTKVAIPDPTQGDGTVSYNEGFGVDYQLDPATNPAALNIPRDKTNQLYYDITQALQYVQSGQVPAWIDASTNGGSAYAYGAGAIALYTDGLVYQSLVAANTATPGADLSKWTPIGFSGPPAGQCRLAVVSGVSLKLSQYAGNLISINGANIPIPAAGVSIANTGLVANTLYYAYAAVTAGALVLELSTTGHSTHTNGVEIKTGDATRTLVGMIRTSNNTPGQFVDSSAQRYCASWYNRRLRQAFNSIATANTTSGVAVDLMPSNHIEFVGWAEDIITTMFTGVSSNSNISSSSNTGVTLDGIATYVSGPLQNTSPAANANINASQTGTSTISEGYHYVTLVGFAGGNTATWAAPGVIVALRQ